MDEETKKLLRENLDVSRETLKTTQKIHRAIVWRRIFSAIKWGFIIIFLAISFWQLQPYLDPLITIYRDLLGTLPGIQDIGQKIQTILGQ